MRKLFILSGMLFWFTHAFPVNTIQTSICKYYTGGNPFDCDYMRQIFCLDSTGNILYEEYAEGFAIRGDTDWVNNYRREFNYDSVGQMIYSSYLSWINDAWTIGNRVVFTYSSSGKLLTEFTQISNGTAFTDYKRIDCLYNSVDSLVSRKEYNFFSGAWLIVKDEEFTYNFNNELITYLRLFDYVPSNGIDTSTYQEFVHYTNAAGLDSVLYTYFLAGSSMDTSCTIYTYDSSNRLILEKKVLCPAGICSDSSSFKSYSYPSSIDTLCFFGSYRPATGTWQVEGYSEHYYKINNLDSAYIFVNYSGGGSSYIYTYDSINRPITKHTSNHADSFHPEVINDYSFYYSEEGSLFSVCYQPLNFCLLDSGMVIFSIVEGQPPYSIDLGSRSIETENGGSVYLSYAEYNDQPFVYTVIDSMGTTFTDSVFLTIPQAPHTSIEIVGSPVICQGQSLTFQASYSSTNNHWIFNGQQLGYSDSVIIDTSGILVLYDWVGATNSSCFTVVLRDTIIVSLVNAISPNLGSDTLLCYSQSVELSPGLFFSDYQWQDGSTDSTLMVNHASSISDTALYSVLTTDTNGCVSSDTIQIVFDICNQVIQSQQDNLKIWPSPADSYLNIETGVNNCELTIKNLSGQVVLHSEFNRKIVVECSDWIEGIYFLEINSNQKNTTKKIFIFHQ